MAGDRLMTWPSGWEHDPPDPSEYMDPPRGTLYDGIPVGGGPHWLKPGVGYVPIDPAHRPGPDCQCWECLHSTP